jgi:hypothetical protein
MDMIFHPAHPASSASADDAPRNPDDATSPVARRDRHTAWTREKMGQFIETLAACGSVTEAARSVGMTRQAAYRLRARMIGQPFDVAWGAALEFGLQQVAHEAMDRALNGTRVPIFWKGEEVGEKRVFNERAVLNLLFNANRIGGSAVGRDWALKNFTDMVARVVEGPIIWTDEEQAAADADHPLNHPVPDHDDEDSDDEEFDDSMAAELKRLREEAARFADSGSRYSASGGGPAPRPQRIPRITIL